MKTTKIQGRTLEVMEQFEPKFGCKVGISGNFLKIPTKVALTVYPSYGSDPFDHPPYSYGGDPFDPFDPFDHPPYPSYGSDPQGKPRSGFRAPLAIRSNQGGVYDGDLLAKAHSASLWAPPLPDLPDKAHGASLWAPPLPDLLAKAILSNQGESSGSGGRAGEERNGGGGDGNQGIGGGVGGGGQREGIGNERRGSRGRSHGGGNGDDDDNDRRGWVGFIVDGRRPMGPRPDRMPEILLPFNFQLFATVESFDITGLSARVKIERVVSLGFTSVALICLSASIRRRGTNPVVARILSCIGFVATFLGFISMIAMASSASFIP